MLEKEHKAKELNGKWQDAIINNYFAIKMAKIILSHAVILL